LDAGEEERLLTHAASCDWCAAHLQASSELHDEELTPEELAAVERLPSTQRAGWLKLRREFIPQRRAWWPIVLAACLAIAFGTYWALPVFEQSQRRAALSASYQRGRPFEYRVDNVPYGPVTAERGGSNRTLAEPYALNTDPRMAAAEAMYELDGRRAIGILEAARAKGDSGVGLANDLAVAYAMLAETAGDPEHFQTSLKLLNDVIQQNPQYAPAYFNRALVLERLNRREEARGSLRKFLELERDPQWKLEAERLLQ